MERVDLHCYRCIRSIRRKPDLSCRMMERTHVRCYRRVRSIERQFDPFRGREEWSRLTPAATQLGDNGADSRPLLRKYGKQKSPLCKPERGLKTYQTQPEGCGNRLLAAAENQHRQTAQRAQTNRGRLRNRTGSEGSPRSSIGCSGSTC